MDPEQGQIQKKKSRRYFIAAVICIEALALLWSIDPSVIYILLGAAACFIFLGFWHRPRATEYSSSQRYRSGKHQTDGSPFQMLRNIFSKSTFSGSGSTSSAGKKFRSFIFAVAFFIVPVFVFVLISLLLGDNETYSYNAVEFYSKAENFRWNGEYDSADYYYRKALYEKPDYPEAWIGYGYDWMAKERYDSAIATFDKALSVEPDSEEARYGKALTYHYQKNYRQSLREALRLMGDVPEYSQAVILTGDNYYMQQRYDSAIYWYENVYDRGERNAWLCHVMAYIYDTKGDLEKAKHLYQETLSYDSTRTDVYRRLGELFPGEDGEFYRTTAEQLKLQGY